VSAGIVWIASYPKSGNTWLRAVLSAWQTGAPARLDALAAESVAARVPFEDLLGVPTTGLTPDEVDILRPRVDELLSAEAEVTPLRKTHDGLYAGPYGEPVVSASATRAALYVVRDPRDVAVSLAHHAGRTMEWAVDRLADPHHVLAASGRAPAAQLRQRLGTWSQHVRSWADDAPFPVHVVRYEDCLADPVRSFAAALRFAELGPVDEEQVAHAVNGASFERLRAAEASEGFAERPERAERFFRSGRAGAWRDEMSRPTAARVEAAHADLMRRFGYL
jgi:aryl sulfotransferase